MGTGLHTGTEMKIKRILLLSLLCFTAIFSLTMPISPPAQGSPTIVYVPDDYLTIQAAVDIASDGDTIIVRDGTYIENVDITKLLIIQSEKGTGSTSVTAANPDDHIFYVTAEGVTISGFTVTGATKENAWDTSVPYRPSILSPRRQTTTA